MLSVTAAMQIGVAILFPITCLPEVLSQDMPISKVSLVRGNIPKLQVLLERSFNAGQRLAVEAFAGVGRIAKYWRRRHNMTSIALDIRRGLKVDLTNRKVRRLLIKALRQGRISALWLATPCSSFSIARRIPIRTIEFIYGVPAALKRLPDRLKIRQGNRLAKATAALAVAAHKSKTPWAIENPVNSRLFHFPDIKKLQLMQGVHTRVLDMCRYGRPYRKRTKILIGGVSPDTGGLDKTCQCSCKHQILEGRDSKGMPLTGSAQVYSRQFAAEAAALLASSVSASYASGPISV